MIPELNSNNIKTFFNNVNILDKNSCWEWQGAKTAAGYGRFCINGNEVYAHRYSWMVNHNTQIPENMEICHHCDNPSCVNPKHLFLGTHAQNMRDAWEKGRIPEPQGPHHKNRGEHNGRSVLSKEDVEYLRSAFDYELRGTRQATAWFTEMATQFGTTTKNIRRVVYKKSWNSQTT